MTPDQLIPALLRSDPARARVTYYDDATGERIELSARVLGNWVCKAANWLQDEADVTVGSRVHLAMPAQHWRTIYWALACWSVGAAVVCADGDFTVSIDPGQGDLIEPANSLQRSEIAVMADQFAAYAPVDPAVEALPEVTYAGLILDLPASSRARLVGDLPRVLRNAASVFAADGSVVLLANVASEVLDARLATEVISVTL